MMKKVLLICCALLLLVPLLMPMQAGAESVEEFDLSVPGLRIGVESGTVQEQLVQELYPEAELVYMEKFNGYTAVAQGKVDCYVYDKRQMEIAVANGLSGVVVLDQTVGESTDIALGLSQVSKIPDLPTRVNSFIAALREDGTLDDMYDRWVVRGYHTMPEIDLPASPENHLTVGTTGIVEPYSFYTGTELTGYDIELSYRLAAWLNADVSFEIYDYGSIVAAAQSGKVDVIAADLQVTPERAEELLFSEPVFQEQNGILVRYTGAAAEGSTEEVHAQDYNGKPLGVLVGPLMEDIAHEYFPDSEYLLLNGYPDCIAALLAGKIDGYLGDEVALKAVIAEQPTITYIPEYLTYNEYNFAFRKNDPDSDALREELNAWLSRSWADGTMQEIDDIWFGTDEARKTVELPGTTGENGTIRVVTTSTDMPFSYIKDGQNVGYDIDVVARFCKARGYGLELVDVDFAARIPTLQSGKADFTTSMNVTPERMEEVNFCDLVSSGGVVLAVRAADVEVSPFGTSLAGLEHANIGVLSGTYFPEIVHGVLPEAEILYYNTTADEVNALKSGKVAAVAIDEPVARNMMAEDGSLSILPELLDNVDYAFVLGKNESGEALCAELSEYLRELKADGTMDALQEKWFDGADLSLVEMTDYRQLPAVNGTIRVAVSQYPPFVLMKEELLAGYEVELLALFCRDYGYALDITDMSEDAVLPSVQSGKCDVACCGLTVTEERKESLLFTEPNYTGGTVLLVANDSSAQRSDGVLSSIADSFGKTFLRENRWKLFAQGIGTTLLITVLSILFGTVLGFLLFMLCRNGNAVANGITNFCLWLVQGTPGVVLLMILYYIIFGRVAISGLAVAVIGFTLTFGAAVFGLIKMGVGTIDRGQYEAAYALGHSNRHTFFKIILPQAIPRVLPAYQGEIVGLIKATAIVGYVAVQDLTKMGDIVRSRTYEAFFPLIAVTVIYFVLEGLFSFAVSRVRISIDPKRRKRETILKGVNTDD